MPVALPEHAPTNARLLVIDRDGATVNAIEAPLYARLPLPPIMMHAAGGREASELLRNGTYEIVLADIGSLDDLAPRLEDAVARIVRLAPGALVIAFLAETSVSTSLVAMRAGAHDCMVKPVSGDALALRIGALAMRLGKRRALGFEDIETPSPAEEFRPVSALPVLPMWQQEQRIIEDAIRSFAGNITLAAQALELSPSTIYRKRQAWAELDGKAGAA